MIKFNSDGSTMIASALVQGDKFVQLSYTNQSKVRSLIPYTVERVLKRDIVCKSQSGHELRFTVNDSVLHCYLPDSPKVADARKELRHNNRCKAAYDLIVYHLVKGEADEELLAAIEAYGERVKAKQQG